MGIIDTLSARHGLTPGEVYQILLEAQMESSYHYRVEDGSYPKRSTRLKARAQRKKMKRHRRRNR